MLHILLVIIKILAIILASILGLLLFLLLIVLFVPIRYRVELRKNDELVINARVTWLLRIVFARIWFIEQQLHIRLRVFGICIYDNLRPKKEKKPRKSSPDLKEKRFKKKDRKEVQISRTQDEDTKTQVEKNKVQGIEAKTQAEKTKTLVEVINTQTDEIQTQTEEIKTRTEEIKTQTEETNSQAEVIKTKLEVTQKSEVPVDKEIDKVVESKITQEIKHTTKPLTSEDTPVVTSEQITIDKKQIETESIESPLELIEDEQTTSESKKGGIFSKIGAFFRKIKSIILKVLGIGGKIKSLVTTIKVKLKKLSELIKGLWEKKNKITAFLKDEINKAGIKMAFLQLLKALKHCAPQKIEGFIRYGTGDPCSTGEAFAAAAFFYGKYGNSLKLVPDFEEEVLEAEVMVKGRIRIFTLLIIGIKLIRDKNFSKLLKNAKQLKEEL